VRDRVLYNLVVFAVIMIVSALVFGQISIGIHKTILINIGLSSITVFGLLIAIFLGIGLVYKEVEKRSLYPLLSKPISRWQFVLGKFLGLNLTLLINTLLMSLGLWGALYYLTGGFQPEDAYIWTAIYFILLELCLVTAVCLFFSCFTTPLLAAIFTFLIYLVGSAASDVREFGRLTENRALESLMTFIYYLLPNFSNFSVAGAVSHGTPVATYLIVLNTTYALSYSSLLVIATMWIFSRRDLK
jgi:ABC-type transport system involved in multi-copper enzyme maturation permease subunit